MRGGIRLDVPRNDGTVGGCTTGFNLTVGVRDAYVLTAGHCVVGGRRGRWTGPGISSSAGRTP